MKRWLIILTIGATATGLGLGAFNPTTAAAATSTAEFTVLDSARPQPEGNLDHDSKPESNTSNSGKTGKPFQPVDHLPGTVRLPEASLPQTGERLSWPLSLVGFTLLLALAGAAYRRKEAEDDAQNDH